MLDRRTVLRFLGVCLLADASRPAAAAPRIGFGELYSGYDATGFTLSEKSRALAGQVVEFKGFMAPPLKPEATFFVLTRFPVSLCPFCNSDAEWPSDIVVVYLSEPQSFTHMSSGILVTGRLDFGAFMDPDTGMVSLVRLQEARWGPAA
ncbi:MAG: hypothetical protein K2P80_13395 [Beijerinckiaceae bacterium]|nr:hypothetical protein [Beijerinckiaceae bacterium]